MDLETVVARETMPRNEPLKLTLARRFPPLLSHRLLPVVLDICEDESLIFSLELFSVLTTKLRSSLFTDSRSYKLLLLLILDKTIRRGV